MLFSDSVLLLCVQANGLQIDISMGSNLLGYLLHNQFTNAIILVWNNALDKNDRNTIELRFFLK